MDNRLEPFASWAEAHGITMGAAQTENRDDGDAWGSGASHWVVTISGPNSRKSFRTLFSKGSAHRRWTIKGVRALRSYGETSIRTGDRVALSFGRRPDFYDAAAESGGTEPIPPEVGEVLYCLAMDSHGLDWCLDFQDWAENYGYDPDSRKAEAVYRKVQEQAAKLRDTLGYGAFSELLELEEDGDMPWPTLEATRERFREDIAPAVAEQYGADDTVALNEAWNNWLDMLCKDGEVTEHQYNTWTRDDG